MTNKTSILTDILENLPDEESSLLEKTATDAGTLTNTENPEAKKKVPTETPTKKEGPLGLSVLSKNKHEDDIRNFNGVAANKPDKKGTEDIVARIKKVEPGLMFEKKASAEVIAEIYEASGIDLEKVASEEVQNDMLMKVAEDTLSELNDLEKVAEALAEETANRFIEKINNHN